MNTIDISNILTIILLALISLIAGTVIIYWHTITRGTWREWPAGQSLMGLLIIIALGFGWGAVNRVLGDYWFKDFILCGLYGSFAFALVIIGTTIRKEMNAGKQRLLERKPEAPCGPVTVIVATKNEEGPDGTR